MQEIKISSQLWPRELPIFSCQSNEITSINYNHNNMVNLLYSWRFVIEILRYKQMTHIKLLIENCICTFDTAHHGSDQSKWHLICFLKENLEFTFFVFLRSLWSNTFLYYFFVTMISLICYKIHFFLKPYLVWFSF